ncbi:MAG: hypothetical protein EPN94_02985 [Nitrospirae bacterium]|nr:MAG: hypothetical protein EPN94_02985 [Nitrospirota bacterium]
MKRKLILLIFVILILVLAVYVSRIYFPIDGTIVDAETKLPIEGAVVLVEWSITPMAWLGMPTTTSYRVIETMSDKSGKFKIKAYVLNPIVNKPDLTIYKAGYVAWSSQIIFPNRRNRTDFKWRDHYAFSLERFKPEYSYEKHTSFIHRAINLGFGESKKLMADAYYWEEIAASKERDEARKD